MLAEPSTTDLPGRWPSEVRGGLDFPGPGLSGAALSAAYGKSKFQLGAGTPGARGGGLCVHSYGHGRRRAAGPGGPDRSRGWCCSTCPSPMARAPSCWVAGGDTPSALPTGFILTVAHHRWEAARRVTLSGRFRVLPRGRSSQQLLRGPRGCRERAPSVPATAAAERAPAMPSRPSASKPITRPVRMERVLIVDDDESMAERAVSESYTDDFEVGCRSDSDRWRGRSQRADRARAVTSVAA